jgi:NodT family efflux transporter outer membrane factor (OMF) lipoprotein
MPALTRLFLTTALALALAGCALGPRPDVPAPSVPARWTIAPTASDWPSAQWWRSFGSLELDRLIDAAQSHNQDIAAAAARLRQADAQARIAGAALLPSLSAQPLLSTTRNLSPNGIVRRYSTIGALGAASYQIDLWGRGRDAHDAAQSNATASAFALDVTRLTIVTGVAATYFTLLATDDQLRTATADAEAGRKILEGLVLQQRQGMATALQVTQQQTVALQLAATVPALQARRTHLADALAILTGALPEDIAVAGGSLASIAIPEIGAGLPSELLAHRPDVQQAERELAAANANIAVARKAFLPSFSLTATGGGESIALAGAVTNPTTIFSLGLTMLQPIFDGGRLRGQLAFANARYEELAAAYLRAVQQAYGDTEDALASAGTSRLAAGQQALAAASADRALVMARIAYGAGQSDSLALLAAEQVAATAHTQLSQAQLSRALAAIDLYKALGGGWSGADAFNEGQSKPR